MRDNACGFTLRLFRNRDGSRCAIAFTTPERLTAVLGAHHRWVPLAEDALRDLTLPLGVLHLVVDPALVAPPVAPSPQGAPPNASQPYRTAGRQTAARSGAVSSAVSNAVSGVPALPQA